MGKLWLCLVMLAAILEIGHSAPIPDDCEEKWFEQRLDHYRQVPHSMVAYCAQHGEEDGWYEAFMWPPSAR
jgi:hypothetical protein